MNSKKIVSRGSKSFYLSLCGVFAIAILTSILLKTSLSIAIAGGLVACFAFGKLGLCMFFSQGWKAFEQKMILGLPKIVFYALILLYSICALGILTALQMEDDTVTKNNVLTIFLSMSIGVSGSVMAWFRGVKDWMAPGSEYEARQEFLNKNYSPELIEAKIEKLRKLQLIL